MVRTTDEFRGADIAAVRPGSSTFPPVGGLRRWLAVLREWHQNLLARRSLADLPDHMLKDIGLTRGDVNAEAARPAWQPLDYEHLERRRRANEREWRRFGRP